MSKKVFIASKIFNGNEFVSHIAIRTKNSRITELIPAQKITAAENPISLDGAYVVPAYKDLQINGAGGIMFSAHPSVDALKAIQEYSIAGGATGFLVTLPTNKLSVIKASIDAIHAYWKKGLPGLLGFHIEGPYINPVKKGAHNEEFIKQPTLEEVKELVAYGKGCIKMITLAPECCSDQVISYLQEEGIILSAGHSNATYEEAKHGFSLGIKLCTHLYNAMSPFTHKEAGLVGAAFDSGVYSGIIPDGIHVNEAAMRVANKLMGDRLFFVTDAITATQNEAYQYIFKEDRYVTEKGTLAGSCLTMDTAVRKAIGMGIRPEDALRKASCIPAKILGKDNKWGKIAPGYAVDWAILDEAFQVKEIISL